MKRKKFWEMNADELQEATKEFDDPNYHPPAVKPPAAELAKLERVRKRAGLITKQLTLVIDRDLIDEAASHAARKGITLSDLVAELLLKKVRPRRKSA